MEFRWVVFITLWTMLSGPVLAPPGNASSPSKPAEMSKFGERGAPETKPSP
jgi:hypothetical protein